MSFRIVCDRDECATDADLGRFGDAPGNWVSIAAEDRAHRDASLRRIYCSRRCAVLALGGDWPENPLSADWRTLKWPPSSELVETVARRLHNENCSCGYRPNAAHWRAWAKDARAVLDAIGADR